MLEIIVLCVLGSGLGVSTGYLVGYLVGKWFKV